MVAARTIYHGLQELDEPSVVTNLLNNDASKTFTESTVNFAEAVVTTDVNYLPEQYFSFQSTLLITGYTCNEGSSSVSGLHLKHFTCLFLRDSFGALL